RGTMTSERLQRQIEALLDEAADGISRNDWTSVLQRANAALAFDSENVDAKAYIAAAQQALGDSAVSSPSPARPVASNAVPASPQPTSFANGRSVVKRCLGEGGRKKVYLCHDASLYRDIAFSLIK